MHAVPLGAQRETKSSAVSDCAAVNLSGLAESAKREWAIYTRALALDYTNNRSATSTRKNEPP